MAELLRLILDTLAHLSPLQLVEPWQRAVWLVAGRHWRTVGPGIYPLIPYLMEVRPIDVVPAIYTTPLQTVTLRDKRTLTYSATFTVRVEDPAAAVCRVDYWPETTLELVSGLLAERLADVDPDRFDPARGKRDRLLEELRAEADAATALFGVRVQAIRFTNFALGIRALRLLTEPATLPHSSHK